MKFLISQGQAIRSVFGRSRVTHFILVSPFNYLAVGRPSRRRQWAPARGYATREPSDVVGWDGYLYPWTFSIHDFEPITGRIHQPPPSHQTFQGQNFVICSFCPRKLDFDPLAVPIPYHHSNLQSEEMIYYVSGNFGSRRGIEVGSVTLHSSGLPHGPHPGLAEKAIGVTETHELAVMCDTFRPLKLSKLARELDDGQYWHSWYDDPKASAGTPDEDPAGLTSHF